MKKHVLMLRIDRKAQMTESWYILLGLNFLAFNFLFEKNAKDVHKSDHIRTSKEPTLTESFILRRTWLWSFYLQMGIYYV